jgi:multiple sugar transport system ATP-binding protein
MSEIELRGVGKRYADGSEAVRDLDLTIADGEFMILVGPSGCGKSTTLRMIAGLEEITGGELRIAGEVVNERAPKERDIAMVFQNYALYPHMTVAENMGFALKLAKAPKADVKAKVAHAAEILDLTEHLGRRPGQLSGGQRQRVAMGRAIVREPKAFLMDEPLSNLDAKLRVQMRVEIARLQRRLGTTTVYVTHDQTEAMTLGDRVAVMRHGVLQQVASPAELYARPANVFVAGFIGSPAMNFCDGELLGDRVRVPFGELPLTDELRRAAEAAGAPREVLVGVRPEAFEDARVAGDRPGQVFEADVDLVESMGSDVYAYLRLDGSGSTAQREELRELASDAGTADLRGSGTVARLAPESAVRAGERARLWIDTSKLHLFDPRTGAAIGSGAGSDAAVSAAA